MLVGTPICDNTGFDMKNLTDSTLLPIGYITDKIIECNGIYYAECEMFMKEYKDYHFERSEDYGKIKSSIIFCRCRWY